MKGSLYSVALPVKIINVMDRKQKKTFRNREQKNIQDEKPLSSNFFIASTSRDIGGISPVT